jgi:NADH-ubiquinone oxidoreductase subunit G, C-terminal
MAKESSVFKTLDIIRSEPISLEAGKIKGFTCDSFFASDANCYMTNSIARHSKTMAKCVEEKKADVKKAKAA